MWAVFAAFTLNGFILATWTSRIPSVRTTLDVSLGAFGLILLAASAGAVLALPIAGFAVGRFGPRTTVTVVSVLMAVGITIAAAGTATATVPVVVVGLFVTGLGQGCWDVAVNVEGAAVEQRLNRAIMPRFHAGFSVGTVAGALIGFGATGLGVPPAPHFWVVAAVVAVATPLAARSFLPVVPAAVGAPSARGAVARAWREPRTLLIGVVVLAFAFSEGTGNDWLALTAVGGYGTSAALGSLAFAIFVTAMTVGRLAGPAALDRWGRVRVLRVTAGVALVGVLGVVVGPSLPVAVAGTVLWGLGASLGFPVGMSAAADDPRVAAARVSVVSSIGYTAFLAGPPLLGLLGDDVGIRNGITAAAALAVVGLLAAGSTRMLPGTTLGARSGDAVDDRRTAVAGGVSAGR